MRKVVDSALVDGVVEVMEANYHCYSEGVSLKQLLNDCYHLFFTDQQRFMDVVHSKGFINTRERRLLSDVLDVIEWDQTTSFILMRMPRKNGIYLMGGIEREELTDLANEEYAALKKLKKIKLKKRKLSPHNQMRFDKEMGKIEQANQYGGASSEVS